MGNMFSLKLWRTKQEEHASVVVSALNFRSFKMSYKARGNLRCVFNIIFFLFSFQHSQENTPQSLLQQSNWGED